MAALRTTAGARSARSPSSCSSRAERGRGEPLASALGAERAGDDHLLDLVGALADREDLRVAVEAAHGVLLDVAVAAVDLHSLLGAAHGEASALELRLRRREAEVAPGVLLAGGLVDEQPRGLDLARHVGELCLDRLKAGDRPAEGAALAGIAQRLVERSLREPHTHRRDADAPDVEHAQKLPEAGTARAQEAVLGYVAVAERQGARVGGVPAHLAVGLALLVARRAVGDDEV